ncbi:MULTISPECIES: AimR family lysis-lysogeny pheromone receptor [Virgibacillus]|uniref:Uncharacterized protein n=2 Tax=Virgibacillus TaxID=84406 RepID=A0A024Q7P7_9BACI|nr:MULTISPECIES: AimR family lysis-lysogeny pheromone receptor [Virgibacillus]EQB38174.1 hypothetical protein M948_06250 [Virgibacillus sp. CM-4]MYL40880.1 hypothetical protein [Virgibacillus massiliensis]GGJ52529.1 hypothetical protein GCM10007111_13350 [Virgibacillus kapii]CDQ38322.1 hypothetical protein BN990_00591 [Virgibacillus massiliensis]
MSLPTTFIAGEDELTLSLEQLKEFLSRDHDNETVMQLIRKYCLQSSSRDIQKKGMEFLYMNGFFEELQQLVEKNKKSTYTSNRQWASIYQIMIDRNTTRYSPHELLQKVKRMTADDPETKCLIEFVKVTLYYDLQQYDKIGNFLDIQQRLFERIDDRFLIAFFNIRLNQFLMIYYLLRNELIMARKCAYRVLNLSQNPNTKAGVHIKLGLSYIFDTYLQGMYHLNEAISIAEYHGLQNIIHSVNNNNIPFLTSHFRKLDQFEHITTTDASELAHMEIAKGNNAKAISILSKIKLDSPFKLYYMGKAKYDKQILLQSYNEFIEKRSDFFFSRLPLSVLKTMK